MQLLTVQNAYTDATQRILDLSSQLTQSETDNQRLRVQHEVCCSTRLSVSVVDGHLCIAGGDVGAARTSAQDRV
jgi:hypothetical protein